MTNKRQFLVAILIISMAFPLTALTVDAAPTSAKATYALIGAMPNPVGLGETVLMATGITDALPTAVDGFTGVTRYSNQTRQHNRNLRSIQN